MKWPHWLKHSWRTELATGITTYQTCTVCGKRRFWQISRNQPVDWHWLETGEWVKPVPPRGGSCMFKAPRPQ